MKRKNKKIIGAGLAALFMAAALAGCKDEGPHKARSGGHRAVGDISHLDRNYQVTLDDIAVRTALGREVKITAQAYCQKEVARHKTMAAYKEACRAVIADKLLYAARHEDGISRFESYLPMGNKEIRPYNYFSPDMMLRALPVHYKYDLYTVTDIRDCQSDTRIATMSPHPPPPPGGWPDAAQRKKLQAHEAIHGKVIGGQCRFTP